MVNADDIAARLRAGLPHATVVVEDPYNDGTHLTARVISPEFAGKTRLQQHRLVYAALGDSFAEDLHALQLATSAP